MGEVNTSTEFSWEDFAIVQKQILQDIEDNRIRNTTFTKYTQSQIIDFLQSPSKNQAKLIEASQYFFNNSSHYRRLIQYYALLPTFSYVLSPYKYDGKTNAKAIKKQFYKVAGEVEKMNLAHELQKAFTICFRDGAFYGAVWSNGDTWYIQHIDPKLCMLSSIENGVWMYAVNMSKIKDSDLELYPPEFEKMKAEAQSTGVTWQEVPSSISFCLKADETTDTYALPPFISTIPLLYSIETYKGLTETRSELENYKMLAMELPKNSDGMPSLPWNQVTQYYKQVASVLPEFVGLAVSPFPIKPIDFERSGVAPNTNAVSDAEDTFWSDSGTSPLLFGSAKNNSAGALKLSIKADECISFALLTQAERQVNRFVNSISGSQKFKLTFLRASVYNIDDELSKYKELATLGFPVKSAISALAQLKPADISGWAFVENEVLECGKIFEPLSTSYTQPAGTAGAPTKDDTELTAGGEETRNVDSNENR